MSAPDPTDAEVSEARVRLAEFIRPVQERVLSEAGDKFAFLIIVSDLATGQTVVSTLLDPADARDLLTHASENIIDSGPSGPS